MPILLADGEEHKNLASLQAIYDRLITERFERKSCILALGGGVIGDLAGLAAATYLRGVPYAQVPTTLLAHVDSSVGGKTGVNHADGKNLIGAFYQPKLVLIDIATLKTLPRRELGAGLAEVIKYGVIEDAALFGLLEGQIDKLVELDSDLLIQTIATSCAIKARVVEVDEREDDYRAVLNFGHTIGHALEAVTGYTEFLHGEAVGVGMVNSGAIEAARVLRSEQFRSHRSIDRKSRAANGNSRQRFRWRAWCKRWKSTRRPPGERSSLLCAKGLAKRRFHHLAPSEILAALSA